MSLPNPDGLIDFRLPSIAPGEVTGYQSTVYGINRRLGRTRFEIDGEQFGAHHCSMGPLGR